MDIAGGGEEPLAIYTCISDAAVLDNEGRIVYIFSTLLVA